MEVTGRQMRS